MTINRKNVCENALCPKFSRAKSLQSCAKNVVVTFKTLRHILIKLMKLYFQNAKELLMPWV